MEDKEKTESGLTISEWYVLVQELFLTGEEFFYKGKEVHIVEMKTSYNREGIDADIKLSDGEYIKLRDINDETLDLS